ncbi:MAG: SGNH/GDSL hydrolase family protein, partial [Lachnospiraceae bacterium]|nr:SGNH/GDSL hydrolase family protein [Lachnospiraceae bacterium]
GVTFIDFNKQLDDIGIDKATDFNDHTHLNYYGSVKFSDHLGEILKNETELPDRRGSSGYESWDEFTERIRE